MEEDGEAKEDEKEEVCNLHQWLLSLLENV